MKTTKTIAMITCARCGKQVPRHETSGHGDVRVCQPCLKELFGPKKPEDGV